MKPPTPLQSIVDPFVRGVGGELVADPNFQHKDLIIIDCSATESILTTAAYHASGDGSRSS
jgi:hypothetical protein